MTFARYYQRDRPAPPDLRRADLLGMLSRALDITEGQPEGHCIRCAYIGTRLGQYIGITGGELADLTSQWPNWARTQLFGSAYRGPILPISCSLCRRPAKAPP
ncbi:hypothetical protein [Octadecabacter sp. SW4]|uniref:hypothetical protein n=1 Tax=Octadecabacter sp. SW4 TaxID=2602067 RepID=UPI0034A0C4B3